MKKLILLLIILTLTLSGCGLFNLDNWVVPDDTEFLALIQELDTPEKICSYMLNNFTYEPHSLYTPDPYTLWQDKKGDCNDFATFGVFTADYHGYETYQIIIFYDSLSKHRIAIFIEDKLSFSDNFWYFYGFNNFREIVRYDCLFQEKNWVKYVVYDYDMNIVEIIYNNYLPRFNI
ncbi:hypothetical protein ES705_38737 [subsurface metagenome]